MPLLSVKKSKQTRVEFWGKKKTCVKGKGTDNIMM